MSNPFLQIWNKHAKTAGEPPEITNETNTNYFGYFQNKHRDQWIFVYDRGEKTGELRGGDIGWSKSRVVQDGKVREQDLDDDEAAWLMAAWKAATFPDVLP